MPYENIVLPWSQFRAETTFKKGQSVDIPFWHSPILPHVAAHHIMLHATLEAFCSAQELC